MFVLAGFVFILALLAFACFRKRDAIAYRAEEFYNVLRIKFGGFVRLNDSFREDLESGLSSHTFSIFSNENDSRAGLDGSKEEIKRIMEEQNISFDKARLYLMNKKLEENNIAPDGTPLDPKAFTFGR